MNSFIREQFPALRNQIKGKQSIFLDGPAGTQVPRIVIDRISDYYKFKNSNTNGFFTNSLETDAMLQDTRIKLAKFLGAESPVCISFGQNMTTLNYSLGMAMGRYLEKGDEIIITQLDHEGNRGPWLRLEESGIKIREVRLYRNGTLDYDHFASLLGKRTKLVAIGWASNILGTVNDVHLVREWTKEIGALLLIDAVHYAPHFKIDVRNLDCDFLLCSAYKFYGPHVGILYSRPGLLDRLDPDRLRTQNQHSPYRIETGTLNHAAIAGVEAALDFLAARGRGEDLTKKFASSYLDISKHEKKLATKLYDSLKEIHGITLYGTDFQSDFRAPTIAFTHETKRPEDICKLLASHGIFAWSGHFYAIRAAEVLGLLDKGGVIRMGICLYNTEEEVDRVVEVIQEVVRE